MAEVLDLEKRARRRQMVRWAGAVVVVASLVQISLGDRVAPALLIAVAFAGVVMLTLPQFDSRPRLRTGIAWVFAAVALAAVVVQNT